MFSSSERFHQVHLDICVLQILIFLGQLPQLGVLLNYPHPTQMEDILHNGTNFPLVHFRESVLHVYMYACICVCTGQCRDSSLIACLLYSLRQDLSINMAIASFLWGFSDVPSKAGQIG